MELCSNALRGLIVASPGRKLVVSDLSNIEGRVLPWMAGEEWKLQAFRDFDVGVGPDMYKLAYSRPFGVQPDEVTSFQRQMGKGMELSMGYGGGVGAFINVSAAYKLDLDAMTEAAWSLLPREVMGQAHGMWDWATKKKRTLGLRKEVYVVCDALKQMWRSAHPKTVALWDNAEAAVRHVILHGGVRKVGPCKVTRTGNWLRVLLPSGRELCYPSPRVDENGTISYMGMNQYTKKWCRINTYGGKVVENWDQGIARDVLTAAERPAEAAGYQIVLTVYDELVTETPDEERYSAEELSAILATNQDWNAGLPLAAGGFEGYRYRKD
jgi:DNA polymerase